jgi:cell wall-associated NlpC family hydrolase
MSFPRQWHDGTQEFRAVSSPAPSSSHPSQQFTSQRTLRSDSTVPSQSKSISSAFLQGSTLLALLAASALSAPDANARQNGARVIKSNERVTKGAWAWTTGSATYLRVRPGTQTPAVAKVPRSTKMFVWGKFNGWYRVETTDHKFGWVRHELLNCPKSYAIAQLSHAKARVASDRSSSQKLYGSASLLQSYRDKHGKPRSSQRVAAAPALRTKAAKPFQKPQAKVAHATKRAAQPAPRLAGFDPALAYSTNSERTASLSRGSQKAPHAHTLTWSSPAAKPLLASAPITSAPAAAAPAYSKSAPAPDAQPLTVQRPAASTPDVQEHTAPVPVATQAQALPAPKSVPAARQLTAQKTPAKKTVAQKPATRKVVAKASVKAQAKKPSRAALRAQWQMQRRQALAQRRQQKLLASRSKLRSHMGMPQARVPRMSVPPLTVRGLHKISPDELMRAREEFLAARQKSRPAGPESVGSGDASDAAGRAIDSISRNGFSNESAGALRDSASLSPRFDSPRFNPSSFSSADAQSASPQESALDGSGAGVSKLPALLSSRAVTVALAQKSAGLGAGSKSTPIRRGGSPRDYFRSAAKAPNAPNAFGTALASRALGYRGVPYRRGGASPRGFDCSGLVYFLLRQKGLNPPRTSGSMASYGTYVPRDQMQAGDIVLFANTYRRGVSHVGLYIGEGKFVHAPRTGTRVRTDALFSGYYGAKFHSARRPQ